MTAALALLAALPLTAKQRVSVHDPSVVFDQATGRYYIFGSHKAGAFSTDMQNWTVANPTWQPDDNATAFTAPAVKTVKKGGAAVSFPQFNAYEWSKQSATDYDINGNMWAPDVIWNTSMQKWCMYLSVNGADWLSSIVLLTADAITGPYTYQGPVVISGFRNSYFDIHKTDLELAIGPQSSLPERYNVSRNWGNRWPHTIDPCVFYDESGKLWMSYGSWSGGIWLLELDENTGLRDYDVKYPSTGGSTDGVTSDPYFGKKVAGGYYVSGEASYIEHIGDYYFLFVTYGGLEQKGGYQMRVFRSKNPNGPYVDAKGTSAIFQSYLLNFGPNADTRGVNIFGAYGNWGDMLSDDGERAQGHNSIIAAEDGRTYLVYHSRFQNGGEGHQVRVHQVFQNQNGWLVAAPFEYTGEKMTSNDIATKQLVATPNIAGTYQLLVHKYGLKHTDLEQVTPEEIILHADGTISGSRSGTWSIAEEGTSYVNIKLGSTVYRGVMVEQTMEPSQTKKTVAFTALTNSGVTVWGYRTGDDPTGISPTPSPSRRGEGSDYYSLDGRKLKEEPSRGVYIVNGKKIIR